MKLNELLTEAKAKFRDTKGTRDKVVEWLGKNVTLKNGVDKDPSIMNAVVVVIAKALDKKKSAGKFSITSNDITKLDKLNVDVENFSKTLYKRLTGHNGGGQPHSKKLHHKAVVKDIDTKSIKDELNHIIQSIHIPNIDDIVEENNIDKLSGIVINELPKRDIDLANDLDKLGYREQLKLCKSISLKYIENLK